MSPRLIAVLVLLAAPAFAADPVPTASGVFKSQDITLEANGAVAFRGKSLFDDSRALIVAVSNVKSSCRRRSPTTSIASASSPSA